MCRQDREDRRAAGAAEGAVRRGDGAVAESTRLSAVAAVIGGVGPPAELE